ncbi:9715_t:CDS:2, partial [Gigaspora rosea]
QVTRERALENAQKNVKERVENPYINSSQELATQETIVVDQDVNMESETTPSGSEEAQLNLHIEEAVIYLNFFKNQWHIDSIWSSKVAILARNRKISFSNQHIQHNGRAWVPSRNTNTINIIACDFNTNLNPTNDRISQAQNHYDPTRNQLAELMEDFTDTAYKLNPRMLDNPFISKEIVADLRDKELTSD